MDNYPITKLNTIKRVRIYGMSVCKGGGQLMMMITPSLTFALLVVFLYAIKIVTLGE